MQVQNNSEILKLWTELPCPTPGNKMMLQYLNTNLWVFKSSDNSFGFLITESLGELKSDYKNIIAKWNPQFVDKINNITLKNCLVIETNKQIDSKLFCNSISSLFEKTDKYHFFKTNELDEALRKMEEITLKEAVAYNEVIGVWGELYLINELLNQTSNETDKLEIIDSWEGVESRSFIDLNIKSKKTIIEVKTTIEPVRTHHFNSLNQVSQNPGQKGFLASICIINDDNGLSCLDLMKSIESKISIQHQSIITEKIKIRGEVCKNNKFHFFLNQSKDMEFFEFNEVPKPSIENGVGKIEWDATLENKKYLDLNEKIMLLNIMN